MDKRFDIKTISALDLSAMIRNHEVSVKEAVLAQFEAIEEKENINHCYITLAKEAALQRAEQVQKDLDAGKYADSPLAGVPIALKDNIVTKGLRTTAGSKMLAEFVPPYDATVVKRLEHAGMIVIGKTNMDEFAMGSTTETSYFGATKHPKNPAFVPGGSSGGSAAAVASGEAVIALGSDTGGSVRQPSAYCGVVGLKPTYGTVSRYGLIAYASSMDQIGPIGRNVADCEELYRIIAGEDEKDSTCIGRENKDELSRNIGLETAGSISGLSGHEGTDSKNETAIAGVEPVSSKQLRIGIPKCFLNVALDSEIKQQVLEAARVLREQGAVVEEFDMEPMEYAIPAYYTIAMAEASSNLSRYDGVRYGYRSENATGLDEMFRKSRSEGFGAEVKRRLMLGTYVLSAGYYEKYYLKALKVKETVIRNFAAAFETYDLILGPTTPTTAPQLGESLRDPVKMYWSDIYTVPANLAGLPAISLPFGENKEGMPIGIQLTGPLFGEESLFKVAGMLEHGIKSVPM